MSNFLSNQNINTLYNYVKNEISQKSNLNLDSDPKYKKVLGKLISTIYQRNKNQTVQFLNNLVIEKSVPFFINSMQKKNNTIRGSELGRPNIIQDNRPVSTSNPASNTYSNNSKNFSDLMSQRQLNTGNPLGNNFDPILSTRPQVRLPDDKTEEIFPNEISQGGRNNLNNLTKNNPNPVLKRDFKVNSNYDKQNINSLLQSLENTGNPTLTQNVSNQQSNQQNMNETNEQRLQKLQNERNFNSLVKDQNSFENKVKQTEDAQKMIFNKIQQSKDDKRFLANLKESRPEVEFDPKQFLMENKMPTDKSPPIQPNFQLETKDFSQDNLIKSDNSGYEKLLENNWRAKDVQEASKKSLEELYQPAGYIDERSRGEMIIVDSGDMKGEAASADVSFTANLLEYVNIDKISDVYLEFLSLQNIGRKQAGNKTTLEQFYCFALNIDEFKMKTTSNVSELSTKYIIPNESFGLNDVGAETSHTNNTTSLNIKLKSNYMTTITPMKLKTLTTKIYGYNETGKLQILKTNSSTGRVMMGLYVKKR